GVEITRWTSYYANSHHFYFTHPAWIDGGRKFLFISDRENATNLYCLDMETGEILQLTDHEREPGLRSPALMNEGECCFWIGQDLVVLDLDTLEERTVFRLPDDRNSGLIGCVAGDDGLLCVQQNEDLSHKIHRELGFGYIGFREYHLEYPRCEIVEVDTRSGKSRVLHEEDYWIGHVNPSPTRPELVSFCHEGPWPLVDQRIWCLNRETGEVWKVRPEEPGEALGHEYWLADGETLGYHGKPAKGEHHVFGFTRFDNTLQEEGKFTWASTHFHSKDRRLIVGDGTGQCPYLLLWSHDEEVFSEARKLAFHRGSWHIQDVHVHPRFSPDGSYVLYTTDHMGYGQVHTAKMPENMEDLPFA
ncbi:MAG: oligogalacturonate lyase family protein, partial [Candidatus Sumerlaeota bacterium]